MYPENSKNVAETVIVTTTLMTKTAAKKWARGHVLTFWQRAHTRKWEKRRALRKAAE